MVIPVFRSLESLRDGRREAVPPDFSLRINPRTRSTEEQLAELARRYGMGESQVKMRLKRTRERLARYLEQEGIFL